MNRTAGKSRITSETEIDVQINIDGSGIYDINTGIGFFNHMLQGFARHGLFDLNIVVNGDTEVDMHHSIEDTGIVLGEAFLEALEDKQGISRFGFYILPMDDALCMVSLDLSGRCYFTFEADLKAERLGKMETEAVKEFFAGFANGAKMNLHIRQLSGENTHHIIEAMFKAFAKALDMATKQDERIDGIMSTKGIL